MKKALAAFLGLLLVAGTAAAKIDSAPMDETGPPLPEPPEEVVVEADTVAVEEEAVEEALPVEEGLGIEMYVGFEAGSFLEAVDGTDADLSLSGAFALALPEGIWFEWEPAIVDTVTVNYLRAGYRFYNGSVQLYGGGFIRPDFDSQLDEKYMGAWIAGVIPIAFERMLRVSLEYDEADASRVKMGYFIQGWN